MCKQHGYGAALLIALCGLGLFITACGAATSLPDTAPQAAIAPPEVLEATPPPVLPEGPPSTLLVYFHGTLRCATCTEIERVARETAFDVFPDELRRGNLEWRSVNYEAAENQAFAAPYKLPFPSLMLLRQQAGHITAHHLLEETWELVETPDQLQTYIQHAVIDFHYGVPGE